MPLSQNSLFVSAFATPGDGDHILFLVSFNPLVSPLSFVALSLSSFLLVGDGN